MIINNLSLLFSQHSPISTLRDPSYLESLSYLHLLPPQNMEHCISFGVFNLKLSPTMLQLGQNKINFTFEDQVLPIKACAYLIFVIFFTQVKFLENRIYTEKRVNYYKLYSKYYRLHSKLPIFRVKSVQIYTGQFFYTGTACGACD